MTLKVKLLLPFILLVLPEKIHSLIGGEPVMRQDYGYVVQIHDENFLAVGTLFTARYVLTVAHCFPGKVKPEKLTIIAGQNKLSDKNKGLSVAAIHRHPNFSSLTLRNDITVLRVKTPIQYNRFISYMSLCSKPLPLDKNGTEVLLVGWNVLNLSEPLKSIHIDIDNQNQCRSKFPQLPAGVSCAVSTEKEGICHGDSGSPLLIDEEVCGMVSGFRSCNNPRHPGLFTDVHFHRQFIARAILQMDKDMLEQNSSKQKTHLQGYKKGREIPIKVQ
ncbi:chymotrypsin-2 [Drosophila ananassae]|uniref:chymotrypsin-2 n=1 Tax=Drosophila ananassae TaxID=7217 RepID=UPI0013A5BE9E|nr:chymotrypsin-2 [Drosophila ananassae]